MKIIPTSYTFDASAQQITCAEFTSIEKLAIITNLTSGAIIYQFNSAAKKGTLAGNTLTLQYDTTAMADTDALQIIIHDDTPLATEQTQSEIKELALAIQELAREQARFASLRPSELPYAKSSSDAMRVVVDSGTVYHAYSQFGKDNTVPSSMYLASGTPNAYDAREMLKIQA